MEQMDQFTDGWLAHRRVLDQLLERVNDDQLSFQPWEGAMSLGDLTLHIVQSGETFANALKTGAMHRSNKSEVHTVAELRRMVQETTDRTEGVLRSLTDADLSRQFERFGSGQAILSTIKDHEIHHKGQLFVYVRLLGKKDMPFFVSRG